jgi:hypothetical protein
MGKPQIEARRPHPVTKPEDVGESPRRDAVPDREAMEPARQQFVGLRVKGDRPSVPNDILVSFADLDREALFAAHSRPSRSRAPRRRDTGT